jgi:hypothetical protein
MQTVRATALGKRPPPFVDEIHQPPDQQAGNAQRNQKGRDVAALHETLLWNREMGGSGPIRHKAGIAARTSAGPAPMPGGAGWGGPPLLTHQTFNGIEKSLEKTLLVTAFTAYT